MGFKCNMSRHIQVPAAKIQSLHAHLSPDAQFYTSVSQWKPK